MNRVEDTFIEMTALIDRLRQLQKMMKEEFTPEENKRMFKLIINYVEGNKDFEEFFEEELTDTTIRGNIN